jgi:hypothetical protein
MSKNFKIARKPGQALNAPALSPAAKGSKDRPGKTVQPISGETLSGSSAVGPTTRKTIEVPEDFFYQVKLRALERKMLEKELWAEIVSEYFQNHPAA